MHNFIEQPKEFQQQIWDRLFEAARVAAMTKNERQAYIKKMNTERDKINQWEYAMREAQTIGLAKGRAEGRAEGEYAAKAAIAKSMKTKGFDTTTISDCTGLTPEEIMAL